MMNARKLSLLLIWIIPLLPIMGDSSVAYLAGVSLSDDILFGDTSWDHLLKTNSQVGVNITFPNPDHEVYKTRVRVTYSLPTWVKVYQLDGIETKIHSSGASFAAGYDFFIGVHSPLPWNNDFFESHLLTGVVNDFSMFNGDYLMTNGFEVGAEGTVHMTDKLSAGLGLSLSYRFFGVHTVGDSSKYELTVKRGFKGFIYPYFLYNF